MKALLRRNLSVSQVAARLYVGDDKIRDWIKNGEMEALNVASRLGKRPRWRISEEALVAFERKRSSTASVTAPPTRRQKAKDEGVEEYF
jgi:excisionase family DNA binding protein